MHKVQSEILGSKLKPEVTHSGQAQLFFFFFKGSPLNKEAVSLIKSSSIENHFTDS